MLEINRETLSLGAVIRNKASLKLASVVSVLFHPGNSEALSASRKRWTSRCLLKKLAGHSAV